MSVLFRVVSRFEYMRIIPYYTIYIVIFYTGDAKKKIKKLKSYKLKRKNVSLKIVYKTLLFSLETW